MASPLAGLPDELAGHQVRPGAPSPILPNGPGYPRIVQAWLWLKKPTWFLDRCSQAYGDVFTMRLPFGINMVHIGRPELVKAVFGGDSDVLRAGEANATILEPLVGPHSVLVLDGPEHLRQRKLILPAFHGDRMRAWEAAVRDITRAEIARWPVGKPFALRPSMQSITLDVIVQVVFGVETSARRDQLRRHILAVTGLGRNPLVLFATRDRRLGSHSPWARFIRARDVLHAALVSEIRQRREAPDLGQRSDVLSQLLLARDDEGRAMTDDEVRDELVTLLFAGHETTATSLAWAFDLLLHHPSALSSLVAELDGGASEYLDATIMETLRVRPVVALVDRHVRQAVGIGGHTIPAGTIACPNIYLVQRRADLYQDPAAFRPDRFVGQPPPAFGWFPFGGGIRRCLGASFATFEMRTVIPEVLRAVTLRPASRRPARVRREAVTFVPHDGARCVVTARSQPSARLLKTRQPASADMPVPRSRATPPSSSGQHAVGHVRNRARGSRLHLLEFQRRDALEQPRAGAERERHNVQPQLVDQAGGEILIDGGRAALDRDIAVVGRRACLCQCRLDSVGDEVVRGGAVHRLRLARVVGEHEDRGVERRVVTPPAVPLPIPLATHWAEHVAPHDECLGGGHLVDLGPVLLGSVEHPGVQLAARAVAAVVAERAFLGLVEPGRVPVGRDRDVADHPAHRFGHCSLILSPLSLDAGGGAGSSPQSEPVNPDFMTEFVAR